MSKLPDPVNPARWPRPSGYSNAMVADLANRGKVITLAGQIGWDPHTRKLVSSDFVEQTRKALENIIEILHACGAGAEEIMRLTWFITDRRAYVERQQEIGDVYRKIMGKNFPAMSVVVVSALVEEGALVEIEATAALP